jgi:hypothetical protein
MEAHQPAVAAAERQSRNPNLRIRAARNRQAKCLCRAIEITPQCTALRIRSAIRGIDLDRLHAREIDHQPIVTYRRPGGTMSAATDCHEQVMLARETHSGCNLAVIRTERNKSRPTINPSVPDSPRFVVACIKWRRDATAQLLAKGSDHAIA